jgi:hypothetical protein
MSSCGLERRVAEFSQGVVAAFEEFAAIARHARLCPRWAAAWR